MNTPDALPIRRATIADLNAVDALERSCFTRDAQSRRSLRYLLCQAHADIWLAGAVRPLGYVCVLYRMNSGVARVYSVAVSAQAQGRGVGAALLGAAECAVRRRGCHTLRAEVRQGNAASRGLFRASGYREYARLPGYYANGAVGAEDGLRLQKRLL